MAIDSDGPVLASRFYERRYDFLHIFNWVLQGSRPLPALRSRGWRDTEIESFLRFSTLSAVTDSFDEFKLEEVALDGSMVVGELY